MSDDIKRASLSELRTMKAQGELHSDPKAPEGPDLSDDFWSKASLRSPADPTRRDDDKA